MCRKLMWPQLQRTKLTLIAPHQYAIDLEQGDNGYRGYPTYTHLHKKTRHKVFICTRTHDLKRRTCAATHISNVNEADLDGQLYQKWELEAITKKADCHMHVHVCCTAMQTIYCPGNLHVGSEQMTISKMGTVLRHSMPEQHNFCHNHVKFV